MDYNNPMGKFQCFPGRILWGEIPAKKGKNMILNQVVCTDALTGLKELPSESVDMCITSPPYWGLRDYGVENQLGLEPTLEEYLLKLVEIFREVRRVLKDDGTLWVNVGDRYSGGASNNRNFNERCGGSSGQRKQEVERPNIKPLNIP